ncbi:hypothetical protein J6T66_00225 [bacterium]|nr:hypothetical protein [bacterium]
MNAFKTSNVGLKIDSKLKEVNDFLAEKGNLKLNDLKSLPEKELMNLMKNGLGGLINNLSTAATE